MNTISVKVIGADKMVASFARISSTARQKLHRVIDTLGMRLAGHVQQTKLRGQVLNQRSGRLISSIHHETTDNDGLISSEVGTNVEYAGVHEYGFTGTVQVRSHMREIKKAWGRPISAREILIRASQRKMSMPERAFLRPSLAEFQPRVTREMQKFIKEISDEVGQ